MKTVDSVLKNFNKAINDLRGVAETNNLRAIEFSGKVSEFQRKESDAIVEENRATHIADKLEKLILGE